MSSFVLRVTNLITVSYANLFNSESEFDGHTVYVFYIKLIIKYTLQVRKELEAITPQSFAKAGQIPSI